jgi:hypothetical protein
LNTRSEIVITIRRGDWTFEVKSTLEDEDLSSYEELSAVLTDVASSVSSHLTLLGHNKPSNPF